MEGVKVDQFSEEVIGEVESLSAIFESEITTVFTNDSPLKVVYKSATITLNLYIDLSYPSKSPSIKVSCSSFPSKDIVLKLESHAKTLVGMPCLYDLVSKAIEIINDLNNNAKPTKDKEKEICKFHLKGVCRFGEKCLNLHSGITTNQTEKSLQNKNKGQHNSSSNLEKFLEKETSNTKKTSMRTAIDVIQRILWDEALPTDQFIVGYLDRFIGVQEKNFTDFSWEDIATVDYNVLAIPKHRIQYFKYKTVKVWDKNERMDKMFGSTGDKELIVDIIARDKETVELSDIVSVDVKTKVDHSKVATHDAKLEIKRNENTPAYSERNRPNYFLCLRITDQTILDNIKKVQQHILSFDERLHKAMIKRNSIHLTLFMMRLENESDKKKASYVIQALTPLLNIMLAVNTKPLTFTGVDHFRGSVLYMKVNSHIALMKFQEFVMLKFKDAGIHLCGNHDVYTPHVTIMKFSRPLCKQLNIEKLNSHYYNKFIYHEFGKQSVTGLRICATGPERGDDQFYITLTRIQNSLLSLSPKICELINQNTERLMSDKIISDDLGNKCLEELKKESSNISFEKSIQKLLRNFKQLDFQQNKHLFILRGLPGSGKTYFVQQMFKNKPRDVTVKSCSADEYFHSKAIEYKFSGDEILQAHSYCRDHVLTAIQNKIDYIFVDNINSNLWEYEVYSRIAKLCGYECHVFQIPCDNNTTRERFLRRSQHKVKPTIHKIMCERWEDDINAVPLNIDQNSITFQSLCKSKDTFRKSLNPLSILYAALYLDDSSKKKLSNMFPAKHENICCDHVTLMFKPSADEVQKIPVGKTINLLAERYFETSNLQLISVKEVNTNHCKLNYPHITLSTNKTAKPQDSIAVLENQHQKNGLNSGIPIYQCGLTGVIGVQVAYSEHNSWKCMDQNACNEIIFKIEKEDVDEETFNNSMDIIFKDETTYIETALDKSTHVETTPEDITHTNVPLLKGDMTMDISEDVTMDSSSDVSIYTGPTDLIDNLFIFDFDGTLFHTPDPNQGRKEFHKLAGYRWPHKGWLSREESVMSPLLVHPGPSLADYYEHSGRANSICILITGRLERTRKGVESVLKEYHMPFHRIILKPEDTNGDGRFHAGSVYSYKKHTVKELIKEFRPTKVIKFWDDRPDNIKVIRELQGVFPHLTFELFHVEEKRPDAYKMPPLEFFQKLGIRRSETNQSGVTEALTFIKNVWYDVIKHDVTWIEKLTPDELSYLLQPFGSYLLHRKGDIDLCLLAPSSKNVEDYIRLLGETFINYGVSYCYYAPNIRCPRIKLRFCFESTEPVEFDIVIACVLPTKLEATRILLEDLDVNTMSKNCRDKKTVIALEGLLFFENVVKIIEGFISLHDFGILVDLVCKILKKQHLKGNAFHCIRTFHIVQVLAGFVDQYFNDELARTGIESFKDYEKVLRQFFTYSLELKDSFWKKLFKTFVPDSYIPVLREFFKNASTKTLDQLLLTGPFINKRSGLIKICVLSTNPVDQWKCMILLEAKLGSTVRGLIDQGVEIVPAEHGENFFSFYTNDSKKCQNVLDIMKMDIKKDVKSFIEITYQG